MMGILRDMWNDGFTGKLIALLLVLCMAVFLLLPWAILEEQRRWTEFKVTHNCKVVGKMRGSTNAGVGVGLTGSGNIGTVVTTTSSPSMTGWLCDDGITYWR